MPMKDCVRVRTTDDLNDLARVRTLLVEALAVLDRGPLPAAVTVAILVSHALEVLSPGADRFAYNEPGSVGPAI